MPLKAQRQGSVLFDTQRIPRAAPLLRTTLITSHADPKEVQRALRHSTLRITLETYVHFWPRSSAAVESSVRC
ncbi:hypothetical protein BG844_07215 [Couchioplanes caeruleus subsp. caeruleus]|uniref:Uncharacterized protein n=1 Tax=Couchioplanes caeruleus subsp. caeruleus TaxID=56427 RepID=A0A1K0FPX2_9ACTN|nr:hypothetical protein BG844_07215 [Couchioplanes caeruleus subsp. caeruleus]